ncbi:hypothetical protein C8J56DRAFT_915976 [Mycena floridula]|nr:hypothetical protein C8J56DRAFT_915976 [Mycena floridula]
MPAFSMEREHYAFVSLELIGAAGFAFILSTATFFRAVNRSSAWYSFCFSWIISCLSYCFLFFTREASDPAQKDNFLNGTEGLFVLGIPQASKSCIVQMSLIYSCPVLTAMTTSVLLIHGWYNVHFGLSKPPLETNRKYMAVLLLIPYTLWFFVFVGLLSFGLKVPGSTMKGEFYCVSRSVFPGAITSLLVVVTTFFMMPIQVSLGMSLFQKLYHGDKMHGSKMVMRVMLFSMLTLVAFAVGVIRLLTLRDSRALTMIMGCLPVAGVLIFGVQRDIGMAWMFCKRSRAAVASQ